MPLPVEIVEAAVPAAPASGVLEQVALKPPLKWAGGKRWRVPQLRPYWTINLHGRLVEPFCGGLAVTMGLMPERALLNDINPHVINFYRWLKRGLILTDEMVNSKKRYYDDRIRFNRLLATGQSETAEVAGHVASSGYTNPFASAADFWTPPTALAARSIERLPRKSSRCGTCHDAVSPRESQRERSVPFRPPVPPRPPDPD